MGEVALHPAHSLHPFDEVGPGFWSCLTCGAVRRALVRLVGEPCKKVLSRAGLENLQRLRQGLWPGSSAEAREYNGRRRAEAKALPVSVASSPSDCHASAGPLPQASAVLARRTWMRTNLSAVLEAPVPEYGGAPNLCEDVY